jgi:hypothetical protein
MMKGPEMNEVANKPMRLLVLILAGMEALAVAFNAVVMLTVPAYWYAMTPGVTSTGPLNLYFVREIGAVELIVASLYAVGLCRPAWRFSCWMGAASWQSLRVLRLCINEAGLFWGAFPFILVPAIVGMLVSVWARANTFVAVPTEIAIDDDWTLETPTPSRHLGHFLLTDDNLTTQRRQVR